MSCSWLPRLCETYTRAYTPALFTPVSSCHVVHFRDVNPCFFLPTCPLQSSWNLDIWFLRHAIGQTDRQHTRWSQVIGQWRKESAGKTRTTSGLNCEYFHLPAIITVTSPSLKSKSETLDDLILMLVGYHGDLAHAHVAPSGEEKHLSA